MSSNELVIIHKSEEKNVRFHAHCCIEATDHNLMWHSHSHARTHTHTLTLTRTHTHTCTHTHMHTRSHAHTHTHARTRTHTCTHTHMHPHTYTQVLDPPVSMRNRWLVPSRLGLKPTRHPTGCWARRGRPFTLTSLTGRTLSSSAIWRG